MYLFRGINETYDENNLKNHKGIVAKSQKQPGDTIKTTLDCASNHIVNGAKGLEVDYWISTTKSFSQCAREYAIPQIGKYNTAAAKKEILVIDTEYWKKGMVVSKWDSCTVFCKEGKPLPKLDLTDTACYPLPVKNPKTNRRYVGGKAITEKMVLAQIAEFVDAAKTNDSDTGLLDCSLYTRADYGNRIHMINELSFFDMSNQKYQILGGANVNGIYSGVAKQAKEVLVQYCIPPKAIVGRLQLVEIEFLSAIKEAFLDRVLQDVLSKVIAISYDANNHAVTLNGHVFPISTELWQCIETPCVDVAVAHCKSNSTLSLEEEYQRLITQKKELIHELVASVDTQYYNGLCQEEDIWVVDLDTAEGQGKLAEIKKNTADRTTKMYDLLAFKNKDTIHKYSDKDYEAEWKKIK